MTVQGIRERVYPKNPEPSALRLTYNRLRKAAIGISISRGIYYNKLQKAITERDSFKAQLQASLADEIVSKQKIAKLVRQLDAMGDVFEKLENAGDELSDEMNRYDNPNTKIDIYRGKPVFSVLRAARRFRQAWLYATEVNDIDIVDDDDDSTPKLSDGQDR